MRNTDALRQLLRSLCHNTHWKYAVFWKLEPRNRMLLTWEDVYFDNAKSSVTTENTSCNAFLSAKPGTISLGCEIDAQCGDSVGCPAEMAVANLSCHTYILGEGIVGKVALKKKHHWIFAGQCNSKFLPECLEECQLQFAAGIKTILVVPFVPRGVVQLGSLDTVREDSTMVAHIKELFHQHIAGSCNSFAPRVDHINPCTPISMPPMRTLSASSALNVDLLDPFHSPLSAKKDSTALYFGHLTQHELSTIGTQFQADLPLSQEVTEQVFGINTSPCTNESTWKAMCNDLLIDPTEKLCFLNQSIFTDHEVVGDISKVPSLEDELNVTSAINQRFVSNQPSVPNSYMRDQEHNDLCFVKHMMDEEFQRELDEEARSIIDGKHFNFPFHSELHKALHLNSLEEHGVWNSILSKTDESSSSTVICQTEVPEAFGSSVEKYTEQFTKESETEHLLDAVIANLQYASDDGASDKSRCVRSCSNSSGNCPDSCLTQYKTDDIFGLEDSVVCRHKEPASFPKNEGCTNSPTGSSHKSILNLLINEEQQKNDMAVGHDKRGLQSSQRSKRKCRNSDFHKPRPRDRQLIQDRLKELRELIPNGSKCSIDVLLDRTVKHMVFLRSIPSRAEKLRPANRKTKREDGSLNGSHTCQNGASWAYEVGGQAELCPLIVENISNPGQILIEMLCKEYGLFLEIAQIIKCLKLTILKGVLESRSDKLWAHYIVEVSRGFHRMDILLPLMQLLQRN